VSGGTDCSALEIAGREDFETSRDECKTRVENVVEAATVKSWPSLPKRSSAKKNCVDRENAEPADDYCLPVGVSKWRPSDVVRRFSSIRFI
jgi:hypothetical protein